MNKLLFIGLLAFATFASAQVKKPAPGTKAKKPQEVVKDTVVEKEEDQPIPREFIVYTKRSKKQRMKLCINLVNGDSILNYCINDSLLHDPEKYKVLFQQKDADSTYVLVYVQSFTKDLQRPECGPGKEIKLFFVRWNMATNKAIVKQKYIESCQKTITRMSREPIDEWDAQSPLKVSYNRGAVFHELTFDPQNYKLGIQSSNDAEKQ